ncbi:hypothetical protein [Methylobacterium radiotolerans]
MKPVAVCSAEMLPVLLWHQTQGVKLIYLRERAGLNAYLSERANGKQVFYVAPAADHVIAGLLFKHDRMNVTGV